jgi:hypothetical protein
LGFSVWSAEWVCLLRASGWHYLGDVGAEYTFFTGAAVCVATLLYLWLKPADSMQIS